MRNPFSKGEVDRTHNHSNDRFELGSDIVAQTKPLNKHYVTKYALGADVPFMHMCGGFEIEYWPEVPDIDSMLITSVNY